MSSYPLLLHALPTGESRWIESVATRTRVERDAILAVAAAPAEAIWLLGDAVVARVALHPTGAHQEIGLIGAGMLASSFALVGDGIAPWREEVRWAGDAWRVDRQHFARIGVEAPLLAQIAERTAADEAMQLAREFALRGCRSALTLLARRLINYFEICGEPVIKVTHSQLSEWSALRRATVTVALQELEAAGAIRARRGQIELIDADRLEAVASRE